MSKFEISSTEIYESIWKLELIKENWNLEKEFIEEIKSRVNYILNWKRFLTFESKNDIHEILCYEIDELIKKYPKIPKSFKKKLDFWRVKEYLKLIKAKNTSTISILEETILWDSFLYNNYNRFKIASFELFWNDKFFWKYFEDPNIVMFVLQFFADNIKSKNILDLQAWDLFTWVKTLDWTWWQWFLNNASKHFFWTDWKIGNRHRNTDALIKLKEIAWISSEN